jgi:hypothetical protein
MPVQDQSRTDQDHTLFRLLNEPVGRKYARIVCAGTQTLWTTAQDHLGAGSKPRPQTGQDLEANGAGTSLSVQMYSNMEQSSSMVDLGTVVMPVAEEWGNSYE